MQYLIKRQRSLRDRYLIIEDRQERLGAIAQHRMAASELSADQRNDADLVKGCATPVWLRVMVCQRRLQVRYAAEGTLVRGLVALLVELYDDSAVEQAADFSPQLLDDLGLTKMLSPTRLHGLGQVVEKIRSLAREYVQTEKVKVPDWGTR